jgi:hypothetical protein
MQNITYPPQGVASGRPHGPTHICGTPVSYDANGNTLSYDVYCAGPQAVKYHADVTATVHSITAIICILIK